MSLEHISIPVSDTVAWIPRKMSKEDYDLLMATLKLWEPKLVVVIQPPITKDQT